MSLLIKVNPNYYMMKADRYKGFFVIKGVDGWKLSSIHFIIHYPYEVIHGVYKSKVQAIEEMNKRVKYWQSDIN